MRPRLVATAALLLVVPAATLGAGPDDAIGFGPYLQVQGPDTAQICAWLNRPAAAEVRLEQSGKPIAARPLAGTQPGCARFAGLEPDPSYAYRLFVDGREVTDHERPPMFVTSPHGTQTLAILGDTRSGDGSVDLEHRRIVQTVLREVFPEAVIHTGDAVERDELPLWRSFFLLEHELLASTPIFPAMGRSDQPGAQMRLLFPLLAQTPWYSFDRGPAHLAVLRVWRSRSQPDDEVGAGGAQARWLEGDLAAARARGSRYLFVVMHEPPFELDGSTPSAVRDVFLPLFERHGVAAVFSGGHYFSHTTKNGVHYFCNGGGGAALESGTPKPGVFLFYRPSHHFLTLALGPGKALVKALDSSGGAFYEVVLGEAPALAELASATATTRTFAGGDESVPLIVFFDPVASEEGALLALLPDLARESGATLVVTFRSLAHAENREAFAARSLPREAGVVGVVGEARLYGLEDIRANGAAAVREALRQRAAPHDRGSALFWVGGALVGLVAGLTLWRVRRRTRISAR